MQNSTKVRKDAKLIFIFRHCLSPQVFSETVCQEHTCSSQQVVTHNGRIAAAAQDLILPTRFALFAHGL